MDLALSNLKKLIYHKTQTNRKLIRCIKLQGKERKKERKKTREKCYKVKIRKKDDI